MIEVLNLGAGVQSSTVLLMSLAGELPKLDHAIFADTGWEPAAVYRQVDWLEGLATAAGVKVHRVKRDGVSIRDWETAGDMRDSKRYLTLPYFTVSESGDRGQVKRQCTSHFKIKQIEKAIRSSVLGLKPRERSPREAAVRQWFGISWDERTRMRLPKHKWSEHYYPLVERHFTRLMCLDWLRSHGYHDAPRSACIGCPYRSNREWREMRETRPDEWADAVAFDEAIRNCGGEHGQVFIHSDRIPLRDANLYKDQDPRQYRLPDFDDECSGMCGV